MHDDRACGACRFLCLAILIVHLVLLVIIAISWSPNPDEKGHLAGGLAIWKYGRLDLYCVNPPIPRLIGALPAFLLGADAQWTSLDYRIEERPEFRYGDELVAAYPERWPMFLAYGRLLLIGFSAIGAWACWRWSTALYGAKSGVIALLLWCFCPDILAWHAVIGTDGPATSVGVAASYAFWRWLVRPEWYRAGIAGGLLGLALLCKMTWVFALPLWPILFLAYRLFRPSQQHSIPRDAVQLVALLSFAVYLVNTGYGYQGTLKPLKDYHFLSRALGSEVPDKSLATSGNRFSRSLLGCLRAPFPEDYVRGADLQLAEFERGQPSYLFGSWSPHGWWNYYLVGLLIKTPVGTIALAILVILNAARVRGSRSTTRPGGAHVEQRLPRRPSFADQLLLLAVAATVIAGVSTQTGFSRHFRYVLPAFPFLFIWVSQVGRFLDRANPWYTALVLALLTESISSSLYVYPHSSSYFNAAVGGPLHGHEYMFSSSFSWGQDIYYLRRWMASGTNGEVPFINLNTGVAVQELGLPSRGLSPRFPKGARADDEHRIGVIPGWHILDWQSICDPTQGYEYFAALAPAARVGYSICVYYISRDDANEIRARLGQGRMAGSTVPQVEFLARLVRDGRCRRTVRAAVLSDRGAHGGEFLLSANCVACRSDVMWQPITGAEVRAGRLRDFDLLVVPGGRASEQADMLERAGRESIREYVKSGGGYLGICAGAFLGSATFDSWLSIVNAQSTVGTHYVPGAGYKMWLDRGIGDVQVDLSDAGLTLFGSGGRTFRAAYSGGPVFAPGGRTDLGDYLSLAYYKSEIHSYRFQEGTMAYTPCIIAAPYGKGKVILTGSHFEGNAQAKLLVEVVLRAAARRAEGTASADGRE
jgi:glutamine amidotransferase-like uncharacterized protein